MSRKAAAGEPVENTAARRICSSPSTISESPAFQRRGRVLAGICAARCPASAQFPRLLPHSALILRPATRSDQTRLAANLEQVHGRRVSLSRLAPAHVQEPHSSGRFRDQPGSPGRDGKMLRRLGALRHGHIARPFFWRALLPVASSAHISAKAIPAAQWWAIIARIRGTHLCRLAWEDK
jgi:hypothetical protein